MKKTALALVLLFCFSPALAVEKEALKGYLLPELERQPPAGLVELGRMLYFDRRLSGDGTMNCATCHLPEEGFSDGRDVSAAYPTNSHFRNTPTVVNAALRPLLTWDGRAPNVEEQAMGVIKNPFEMNINLDLLEEKLRSVPEYREGFRTALGTEVTKKAIVRAIGAFERTVLSGPSPFDLYVKGDDSALGEAQKRGLELFFGKAKCIECHDGPNFGANKLESLGLPPNPKVAEDPRRGVSMRYAARTFGETMPFGEEDDWGLAFVTGDPRDKGVFLVPSLRQLVRTAPYGHDGRFPDLDSIIDLQDKGGGTMPGKSEKLKPLGLTAEERADLKSFLESLTGPDPVVKPKLPAYP
ncbi:c-type cytochrome [bacterium]|nr:MAG: c-type cytochrome [bacterium]